MPAAFPDEQQYRLRVAVGRAGKVIAMDIQVGMLLWAKEKALASHLSNIEFLHAGSGEGQLLDGRFERALSVTVLDKISDQDTAMKEIYDARKPDGILSVIEAIDEPWKVEHRGEEPEVGAG